MNESTPGVTSTVNGVGTPAKGIPQQRVSSENDIPRPRVSSGNDSPRPVLRRDIQGLRAVAVGVVILDHLVGWPVGGFIGVDVFFVISGFVITTMLLREHQRTGQISFTAFYRRRIRRILPVSTLVVVVTVVAGRLLYLPTRARTIEVDAAWAALFGANWHFAAVGTDYWADDGLVSPLQHYWSLSVEEQFYFVWPVLIAGTFAACGLLAWTLRRRTLALGVTLTVVVAASFGWAVWETAAHPTRAYFSTFSRVWELGLGALIAIAAPLLARVPDRWRPRAAWMGLAGIAGGLFLIDNTVSFPAPWALLPAAATGLVIAAGTGGHQPALIPLTNPVSQWIGNLSFSLYLWHFPAIVLMATVLPVGRRYDVAVAVTVLVLSALSYHLLEDPIRRSSWLEPTPRHLGTPAVRIRRRLVNLSGAGLLLAVVVTLGALAFVPHASAPSASPTTPGARPGTAVGSQILAGSPGAAGSGASSSGAGAGAADSAAARLTARITSSLAAEKFPEFAPGLDTLGVKNWVKEVGAGGCADVSSATVDSCVTEPDVAVGGLDVAVIGDSYAIAWLPAIREALLPLGWRVHSFTRGQCPVARIEVTRDGGDPFPECDGHRDWAIGAITALHPDLVILADSDNNLDRLADGAQGTAAQDEYEQGLASSIAALGGAAPRTVVLTPPPKGGNLLDCVSRVSSPGDCETRVGARSDRYLAAATSAVATDAADVALIDTTAWFCVDRACPGFVGSTPVRVDGLHLTVAYSDELGPVLRAALSVV